MKTGDVVQDAQGRSYQVGPLLGRGLWGKSYLVRHGDSDAEFVLKCPLDREDFRGEVTPTDSLLDAFAEACKEQGSVLGQGDHIFLPPVQSRQSEDGSPLLITPRFTTTLDRRISQGCTLGEVLRVLLATADHLSSLADDGRVHGNLRPSNVLLNDRGEVLLTDMTTPASRKAVGQLHAIGADSAGYLPPEAAGGAPLSAAADTYALAMILYRAALTEPDREPPTLPQQGLDKADLVELKDRVVARLQKEDSNPRFHARFSERLASMLNRALSKEASPSPPFRFNRVPELKERLEELLSLVRPDVALVGKIMLQRPPNSETFETDEEVAFSVTVGTTPGVEQHDDVACGIAIFDAETDERIRDANCQYTVERHPSGRFRFAFKLSELGPGRYRTRLAFAVRDSGHQPTTAEAHYEVRAAAGYVPPVAPPQTSAIPFAAREPESPTQPSIDLDGLQDPQPIQPSPVAPPQARAAAAKIEEALRDPAFGDAPEPTGEWLLDAGRPAPQTPRPPTPRPPTPSPPAQPPALEPNTLSHYLPEPELSEEREKTQPAVTLGTQIPQPDPLRDIVGGPSWTSVPLPGSADTDLSPQDLDDVPDPDAAGPLQRIIDMVRGDVYLMFMGAAGLVIVALIVLLAVLKN